MSWLQCCSLRSERWVTFITGRLLVNVQGRLGQLPWAAVSEPDGKHFDVTWGEHRAHRSAFCPVCFKRYIRYSRDDNVILSACHTSKREFPPEGIPLFTPLYVWERYSIQCSLMAKILTDCPLTNQCQEHKCWSICITVISHWRSFLSCAMLYIMFWIKFWAFK